MGKSWEEILKCLITMYRSGIPSRESRKLVRTTNNVQINEQYLTSTETQDDAEAEFSIHGFIHLLEYQNVFNLII